MIELNEAVAIIGLIAGVLGCFWGLVWLAWTTHWEDLGRPEDLDKEGDEHIRRVKKALKE